MEWLKAVCCLALCWGLLWTWQNHTLVTDAYAGGQTFDPLDLPPLDLSRAKVPEHDPLAFELAQAPDMGAVDLTPFDLVEAVATPATIEGGGARLSGRVSGIASDSATAVVELDRFTDGGSATLTVGVDRDGRWRASGIRGGRYRVRAYVPGELASAKVEVLFLPADGDRQLELAVIPPGDRPRYELSASDELPVGVDHVVAVVAGQEIVDANGRTVVAPIVGAAVDAEFSSVVRLLSERTVTTDEGGAARYLIDCTQVGTGTITFRVAELSYLLPLPPCVPPEAPVAAEPEEADG